LGLNPDNIIDRENAADSLLNLNRFSEARKTLEDALAQQLDDDVVHVILYNLDFVESDAKDMSKQAAWFQGKPEVEFEILCLEANTAAYGGHLAKARQLTRQAMESAERADNKEAAASEQAIGAFREILFGNSVQAQRLAAAALLLAPYNREVFGTSALVFALTGDAARARTLAQDLDKRFPLDTLVQYYWLPTIRSQLALEAKDATNAIEQLQSAAPIEFGGPESGYPVYVRGLAYLASRQGDRAALEFEKLLDHRGSLGNCPIGALAHLGLARAHVLQGETSKGRAAYQDFLTLWNDADPDIPILKQAKAEYAKLTIAERS
jgi:predicted Zn-dependent protease